MWSSGGMELWSSGGLKMNYIKSTALLTTFDTVYMTHITE